MRNRLPLSSDGVSPSAFRSSYARVMYRRRPAVEKAAPTASCRRNTKCVLAILFLLGCLLVFGETPEERMEREYNAETLVLYRKNALSPKTPSQQAVEDFSNAVTCLRQLHRMPEFDTLAEEFLAAHPHDWRCQVEVASHFDAGYHFGLLRGETFLREAKGVGRKVSSQERDRVQALRLLLQAMPAVDKEANDEERLDFYSNFIFLMNRSDFADSRIFQLTDLAKLPEYEPYPENEQRKRIIYGDDDDDENVHAPEKYHCSSLQDDGVTPIQLPSVPSSWETAKNDGERCRWLLEHYAAFSQESYINARLWYADMLKHWFPENTFEKDSFDPLLKGTSFQPEDLQEDEIYFQGVRVKLPPEQNYIAIWRELTKFDEEIVDNAYLNLAQFFDNRRQYGKALECWRQVARITKWKYGAETAQDACDRITGIRTKFPVASTYYADNGTCHVPLVFKNTDVVKCVLWEIDETRLAKDFADALAKGQNLDGKKGEELLSPFAGYLFGRINDLDSEEDEEEAKEKRANNLRKYLKRKARSWDEKLTPAPDYHFCLQNIAVSDLPGGCFLLEIEVPGEYETLFDRNSYYHNDLYDEEDDGDDDDDDDDHTLALRQVTHRVLLQNRPVKVLRTPVTGTPALHGEEARSGRVNLPASTERRRFLQVLDSQTGAPLPNAEVSLLGWKTRNLSDGKWKLLTTSESGVTDQDGFFFRKNVKKDKTKTTQPVVINDDDSWKWYLQVKDHRGNFLFLPYGHPYSMEPPYIPNRMYFGTTDRPAYRPGDTVHIRVWTANTAHAPERPNPLAGKTLRLCLVNPLDELAVKQNVTADEYGATSLDWTIPRDATLGRWHIRCNGHFTGSFRVEEYKRPEFEVLVQEPKASTALGEPLEFHIKAKYYFGAPVSGAEVRVRVLQEVFQAQGWPARQWDWCYGNGYGWDDVQRPWLPGWERWGRVRSHEPRIWHRSSTILQKTIRLDENGEALVKVDTDAKADHDCRFTLVAEVQDQSLHTVTGDASAIAPRVPFHIFPWTDSGFYQVGDTATVHAQARTANGTPVAGTAVLRLYRLLYDQDSVTETLVREWNAELDRNGYIAERFPASQSGQFRIAFTVTDTAGHQIEAARVFPVFGPENQDRDFRFAPLELTLDKLEYAPGETARLAISTERPDSFVMLIVRPEHPAQSELRILHIKGKTTLVDIPVKDTDMPNLFVDAWTVADGRVHHLSRELFVPPARRTLKIAVEPEKQEVRPGAQNRLGIRVTGTDGAPVRGAVTVAVYDRSLDAIAQPSEVSRDIVKALFGWKNRYHPFAIHVGGPLANPLDQDKSVHGIVVRRMKMLRKGAAPMGAFDDDDDDESFVFDDADGGEEPRETQPSLVIRRNFADTALLVACIETDADGRASLPFHLPESLTSWNCLAWAVTSTAQAGYGHAQFTTASDLMVRLQAPQFLVETDEVVLAALVDNRAKTAADAQVALTTGSGLRLLEEGTKRVVVPAGGQARVEWRTHAEKSGSVQVRVVVVGQENADGMEILLPVKEYGIEKQIAVSRALSPEQTETVVSLEVPQEIRGTARLAVRWSPSLALAMTDALPYLFGYPYGCTEQTLNRFLPALLAQKTLQKLGIELESLKKRRANLNAQELGDASARATQWKHYNLKKDNPVFDSTEMRKIIQKGIQDLTRMQCRDGGWGWFYGPQERSWAHETARVVHGFHLARQNGAKVPDEVFQRGVVWLYKHQLNSLLQLEESQIKVPPNPLRTTSEDALVFHVLCEVGKPSPEMADFLCRDRKRLPLQAKSLAALGLHLMKDKRAGDFTRDLREFLQQDKENQTAWLDLHDAPWWWYTDPFETQAAFLKLLLAEAPKDPVAPRLVKYLLNNRKNASCWRSTRDTAACLEAFAEYLAATGEDTPDTTVELLLDGKHVATSRLTRDNLFDAELSLLTELPPGTHTLVVRHAGKSPLYLNTYLTYFSKEERLAATGTEIQISRQIYLLKREPGKPLRRRALQEGDGLNGGDELEVKLTLTSKNTYEYLCIEDRKAAGTEPVEFRSGYLGERLGAYTEFRDDRVAMMLRTLPQGTHTLSYRIRAEHLGRFTALPTTIHGMYAPELHANSNSLPLQIAK
ncbi:MAG: hypothetical protein IJJ26_10500 [Victivallales bacterium]|nr:hypothetical protein [Victivallales bacterium]